MSGGIFLHYYDYEVIIEKKEKRYMQIFSESAQVSKKKKNIAKERTNLDINVNVEG